MTAIVHRYDHALSFDRITAACAGCEAEWPCDLAGHKGGYGYSVVTEDEFWWCAIDCPHPRHSGSREDS